MPKMKTKSGAKKRFRITATGKIKHGGVGKRPDPVVEVGDLLK